MIADKTKLAGSRVASRGPKPGAGSVGRKQTRQPDASTPAGQCALYLAHLLKDRDIDDLADKIGRHRGTLFNYTSGTTEPNREAQDEIAKAIGLRDYRDLAPTDEFLASLGVKARKRRRAIS